MTVFEKTSFGFGFGLVDFSHHEAGSGLGLWLRFIYFKFNNMEIDQAKQRQAKPEKCEAEASRFKKRPCFFSIQRFKASEHTYMNKHECIPGNVIMR